jgi:hypothetical protein
MQDRKAKDREKGRSHPEFQKKGGAQMTAMNTARKKGTRMELTAFIPATTMTKLATIRIVGILATGFPLASMGSVRNSVPNQETISGPTRGCPL